MKNARKQGQRLTNHRSTEMSSFAFVLKKQKVVIPSEKKQALAWRRSQSIDEDFTARFVARFLKSIKNLEQAIEGAPIKEASTKKKAEPIIEVMSNQLWTPLAKQEDDFLEDIDLLESLFADLIAKKGELEARRLLKQIVPSKRGRQRLDFSFNVNNPDTIKYLEREIPDLIREINKASKEAVRDMIQSAIDDGITAPKIAQRIREEVGLTNFQRRSVDNFRKRLEAQGVEGTKLNKAVMRFRRKKINQRGRLIARTEITRAESHGQEATWKQMQEEDLLPEGTKQKWIASPIGVGAGGRTDDICLELHRSEPVPLGESFQTENFGSYERPPDPHPGCRCSRILVFPEDE